jgi:oligopeptide/dipeptide ABC transporter ATP-binding protein
VSASTNPSAPGPLLAIRGLKTWFATERGTVRAVDGVDLDVWPGECLGVVGESGSGKSATFASVMGLVRPPGRIVEGVIAFDGQELTALDARARRRLRGRAMAMTMQDALTALNPAFTVGTQIVEMLEAHGEAAGRAARERAIELMRLVGIPAAETRIDDYPHQFSGGMRQRIMIAIALACRPRLLIADEPTTALDVTIQAQVLDLIGALRRELGMSVVLITHNLAVVATTCERVAVMYAGQVVELGPTAEVIAAPRHPYTQGLLRSLPSLDDLEKPIEPIAGQVPDLTKSEPGCRFRARCTLARAECAAPVAMRALESGREARCVLAS